MFNKTKEFNFDFVGKKKIFFLVSSILMVVVILSSFVFGVQLDIQFKGGSIISYTYTSDSIDADAIQKTAEEIIGKDVTITTKTGIGGQSNSFDITVSGTNGLDSATQQSLADKLDEKFGKEIALSSITNVDPVIGGEFLLKSAIAVGLASLLIIIYVALRFKKIGGWSAGVAGIVALVHDVIIVYGTFVIFRIPIDSNFIAAVLTILGFSINDTIVIYDRLRENKRLYKGATTDWLINKSINQSITRSVNTSVCTILTMVVVSAVAMFMGVDAILSFSFPMILGMISGVYSTIFIAGPLWVTWQNYKATRRHNPKAKVKAKAKA